jgi:hypothetical protein
MEQLFCLHYQPHFHFILLTFRKMFLQEHHGGITTALGVDEMQLPNSMN